MNKKKKGKLYQSFLDKYGKKVENGDTVIFNSRDTIERIVKDWVTPRFKDEMNKKKKEKRKVLKKDMQVQEFHTRGYGYSYVELSNSSNKNIMTNKIKQIGDKVWFLENNKIKEGIIGNDFYCVKHQKEGIYKSTLDRDFISEKFNPEDIFSSKEELIESLSK